MATALAVIAATGLTTLVATVLLTLAIYRFFKTTAVTVLIGGLTLPVGLAVWGIIDLTVNLDVDDTAPGNLIIGGILVLAVVVPFTVLVSFLTARYLGRRVVRRG